MNNVGVSLPPYQPVSINPYKATITQSCYYYQANNIILSLSLSLKSLLKQTSHTNNTTIQPIILISIQHWDNIINILWM